MTLKELWSRLSPVVLYRQVRDDPHTVARLALSLAMLSASLYVVLWAMSFMGHGTTYPTGEPIQRSFDPVLTAALSIGAGILAGILMPYLPGQANHD